MKRLLSITLILLAVTVTTARDNNSVKPEVDIYVDETICSYTCSFTFENGYYVETTAGSIFRTCETAARLCYERLGQIVAQFYAH